MITILKLRETDIDEIRSKCLSELNTQLEKLFVSLQKIISLFENFSYQVNEKLIAREEAKERLRYFNDFDL